MLKLNGKPFALVAESPSFRRLLEFLEKAPADEIYTREELANRTHVCSNTVCDFGSGPAAVHVSMRTGKHRYYGSPKAIKALAKQMAEGR